MKIKFGLLTVLFSTFAAFAEPVSPIIGLGQENFDFSVSDIGQSRPALNFEPNMAGVSRLGINAFGFGIGYSFRGSNDSLDPRKGTTTFYDLQLGYHTRKWGLDSFYQTYQGFYTGNTVALQTFPDLKFKHYGLMGRWALSDTDFSVGGLLDQSNEIRKSAGKFYVIGGVRHHSMETSTSLLQQENANINREVENLRKIEVTSINGGFGYGHYFISQSKFFVGALSEHY
ncbi:MAG: DUF4421 family protein [Bdellovibrionaceae bacterium]|nr:DUF4421 family protein [Bdellovibrio sp.]